MPLPVIFATLAQGSEPLSLLDTQFAAVSSLLIIPCFATGQNNIALTPPPNTPTISKYTDYAPVFTWSPAQTSTATVTISVSGLASLNAYGSNGGVVLGSGDIVAGNVYQAAYNESLNSGNGGFVVNAQTPVTSQGTWVPKIAGSSVAGTPVYVTQSGSYEQIGRQVTARFAVQTSAITGVSGDIYILGLPFPNNATDVGSSSIAIFSGWTSAGYTALGGSIDANQTQIRIVKSGSGVGTANVTSAELSATVIFTGTISYHV